MGRATSVFFFCVAIDPLITFLNSIPRVHLVKAYMDDNATIGTGTYWIHSAQDAFTALHSAGFQVLGHSCCAAWPLASNSPPSGAATPTVPPPNTQHATLHLTPLSPQSDERIFRILPTAPARLPQVNTHPSISAAIRSYGPPATEHRWLLRSGSQ